LVALPRIPLSHPSHHHSLVAKYSFRNQVNMLQMEQRDKLHGHCLVEQLHLNGILVKSAQLTLLQHQKLLAHTEL
jgi:hypothetical protein